MTRKRTLESLTDPFWEACPLLFRGAYRRLPKSVCYEIVREDPCVRRESLSGLALIMRAGFRTVIDRCWTRSPGMWRIWNIFIERPIKIPGRGRLYPEQIVTWCSCMKAESQCLRNDC